MDLKIYQREMWITLKKYLNLVSSKRDKLNDKSMDRNYLELVKEVISINEKQKLLLSTLRQKNKNTELEQPCSTSGELTVPKFNQPQQTQASLPAAITTENLGEEITAISNPFSTSNTATEQAESSDMEPGQNERKDDSLGIDDDYQLNLFHSGDPSQIRDFGRKEESIETYSKSLDDNLCCDSSPASPRQVTPTPQKENFDDIHDLVTSYEFMQSLGLLTIRECEEVLKKRRERHKKNAFSHLFCQSIWEKQETKRKKRDWLLSSSPPQLRRKVRNGSRPPSRQPSRPSSPLEGGSSSPPSSLSPPSPISPRIFNPSSQSSEEICPLCKEKGASYQCDGCGVFFHNTCVGCPEDEGDSLSEWLCSKCETLGMRMTSFSDPIHQKLKGVGRRSTKESGLYDP